MRNRELTWRRLSHGRTRAGLGRAAPITVTAIRRLIVALAVICILWESAAGARGAQVVVLGSDGHASVRDDVAVSALSLTAPRERGSPPQRRPAARAGGDRNVRAELARLYRSHQIDERSYGRYRTSFNSALTEVKRLSRRRGAELEAVVENLHAIAVRGMLTPSRLPALFLTLDRNRQWWRTGPLLAYGQRVEFAGSQLVWEYYPGQGIELQELGSFGKAQWYCANGSRYDAQCREMLSELIPLAAERAGGLTWEYYFNFDGGVPPWTSAMSQGTALQALADAFGELRDSTYLDVAASALSVFRAAPPAGVRVRTPLGARFLQYSFAPAPAQDVLNGFLQSLIGLSDYARVSGNALAAGLFAAGDAQARAEVRRFDTGAWSLYQPGEEDTLDYHTLVTGFLGQLCRITDAPVYCETALHFEGYLKTPPVLRLSAGPVRARTPATLGFRLSKVSRVGITVLQGGRKVFSTSAPFSYGRHAFEIPALSRGIYTVRLDATDLAGNYCQVTATLTSS